jgi:hypothetical protein
VAVSLAPTSDVSAAAARQRRVLGAFVILCAAVCTYAMRQADPDLWGYLAYGRLFLEQGKLTSRDVFTYTSAGSVWVTHEYVAHVLLWLAYDRFGTLGLIALKCVFGSATLYCVYRALRSTTGDARIWLPLFALSATTVSRFFLFRPQLFTFAFFAYFVAVILSDVRRGDWRVWTLPLVMLIWANSHGGFLAGVGALGLALAFHTARSLGSGVTSLSGVVYDSGRLWLVFAASLAATVINPHGPKLWSYVITEMVHGTNRHYIAEWGPASLSGGDVWSSLALTILAALVAAGGWLASRPAANKLTPPAAVWILSCVPLIAMSYLSVRHVPLAVIWSVPVVGLLLTAAAPAASATFRRMWTVLSAGALVTVYATAIVVWLRPSPDIAEDGRVLGTTNPCEVVAFLRANQLHGNVYNPLWWGSYITWETFPAILVAMDGRNITLFPDAMVTENMRFYTDGADAVELDTPLRHATDYLLVPTDMPALSLVIDDPRWSALHVDKDAMLFVRTTLAHQPLIDAARRGELTSPSPPCRPTL